MHQGKAQDQLKGANPPTKQLNVNKHQSNINPNEQMNQTPQGHMLLVLKTQLKHKH